MLDALQGNMLKALGLLSVVIGGLGLTIWRIKLEIGAAPPVSFLKREYAAVPYFNGRQFIGPSLFPKVKRTSGRLLKVPKMSPATFFHILLSQSNAPKQVISSVKLSKSDFLALDPAITRVYWLGHAAAIIELAGYRIAIDPVLDNAAPVAGLVKRYQPPVICREQLPSIDLVLITHNHYDHLERRTVQAIAKHSPKARFLVPLGLKITLIRWGISDANIIELAWEASFEVLKGLKVVAEPSAHFSGRGLSDHNLTAWNSYALINIATNEKIFWGCDGGYGPHFKAIGQKHQGFNWIALEIDAWNQRWPYIHLSPEEVLAATKDLQTKRLMPIHWGVFNLADHKFSESIEKLLKLKPAELIIETPKMGELWLPTKDQLDRWWQNATAR